MTPITMFIKKNYVWLLFFLITIVGLYLRFYGIEQTVGFGWDQGRDAWTVLDIIRGNWTLMGPRTGVGQFHLGPLYYYFLVPFFYLTHLDPMASNYLNFVENVCNFFIIFFVTKKIFSNNIALLTIAVFSFSNYMIYINSIPWNVSLVPGIAVLIFYAIYKIYNKEYSWFLLLAALTGFFFHLHFAVVFVIPIVGLSLLFLPNKKKALPWMIGSIPIFLLFIIPNIIADITNYHSDYFRIRDFMKYYVIGFHLKFLLHRLHDAFIQFNTLLYFPIPQFVIYGIFLLFLIFNILLEHNKTLRLYGYLISLWFIVPLVCITFYVGPLSEYYFLLNAPFVIYILILLQKKLLTYLSKMPSVYKITMYMLVCAWGTYFYYNTLSEWVKPVDGGLSAQKEQVQRKIAAGEKIRYGEGDITSYLYEIWTHKNQ